jgi:MFS family permease
MLLVYADKVGRKMVMQLVGPVGMIGASIGLIFNSLVGLTFSMTILNVFHGTIFSLNFIYLNEIIIDPLRSKANGINTFALTLGVLSNFDN